jgi:hypothetical protein
VIFLVQESLRPHGLGTSMSVTLLAQILDGAHRVKAAMEAHGFNGLLPDVLPNVADAYYDRKYVVLFSKV